MSMRMRKSVRLVAVLVATAAIAVPAATVAAPSAFAAPAKPSQPSKPSQPAKPGPSQPSQPAAPATPSTPTFDPPPNVPGPQPVSPPPVKPASAPPDAPPSPKLLYDGQAGFQLKTGCTTSGAPADLTTVPWGQSALQIDQAHKFATGAGETVAVIDTGVNPHKEFGEGTSHDRLMGGGDYVGFGQASPQQQAPSNIKETEAKQRLPKGPDGTFDCYGHGTEVAGIIGANTQGTGWGFDGVAPDANILAIRQTDPNYQSVAVPKNSGQNGQGEKAGTLQSLAYAISHVVALQGKKPWGHIAAINISLTDCQPISEELNNWYTALQAAIHNAVQKGIVVVAAAGNAADSAGNGCKSTNDSPGDPDPNKPDVISLPAWFGSDVLSVAAIGSNGDPSSFSVGGPWVGVAGPGDNIISLDPGKDNGLANTEKQGNQTSQLAGTSFAAPYVSGLVALIAQKYNNPPPQQIIKRIEATAQHPAGPTGRNDKVGYGMINPVAALTDDVAGEDGVQPGKAANLPANLPPPYHRNWTPIVVAFAGAGSGLGILLLTMFILHTIRRNRERDQANAS